MPHGKVGVVTVTYNSGEVLDPFLISLQQQSFRNFVLYVIDNSSEDDTLHRLKQSGIAAISIQNEVNLGFATAANQGIVRALENGCDFVLLLNNDTHFPPNLIEMLLDELSRHSADMISPKIRYAHDPETVWYAGGDFNPWRGFAGTHAGLGRKNAELVDAPRACGFAPACCLLVRREVFGEIGLLDPRFFLYFEDTDFCYRARRQKLSLWYTPRAEIYHAVGSLAAKCDPVMVKRFNTQGHAYFLYKHFGAGVASALACGFQGKIMWKYLTGRCSWLQTTAASRALWERANPALARKSIRKPVG